jgi:hypothetical protein
MVEYRWTPEMVAAYLAEAADTLRRLPSAKVQGCRSSWPPIVQDFWEMCADDDAPVHLGPPTAKAIDQMDKTLLWLRWLEKEDQRLVWDRANHRPWKVIAADLHVDRSTAWRRWTYAVGTLVARLNAIDVHARIASM